MKTYIINETSTTFLLKEGNAGAFRTLGELKGKNDPKKSKFTIKVDPNATYREYMVATGKKGNTIIITSDDFTEYEEIRIRKVDPQAGAPSETYKSVPSKPRKKLMGKCLDDSSSPAGSSNDGAGGSALVVPPAGGESAPRISSAASESIPRGSSNAGVGESIPSGSSVAGPGQPVFGVSFNAIPVEAASGGSLNAGPATGGSNHVAWYKKLFKSPR